MAHNPEECAPHQSLYCNLLDTSSETWLGPVAGKGIGSHMSHCLQSAGVDHFDNCGISVGMAIGSWKSWKRSLQRNVTEKNLSVKQQFQNTGRYRRMGQLPSTITWPRGKRQWSSVDRLLLQGHLQTDQAMLELARSSIMQDISK